MYKRDYRERKILVVREKDKGNPVKYGTITFYVFYPNNYSGRNDAPQIQGSVVNALDYLAGGIFTQKQYVNNNAVTACIEKGTSMNPLAIRDLPTETADRNFEIDYVPRGYEMLKDQPLSISLNANAMTEFYKKSGFYYAPIYDGLHTWNYRIDNETLKQQLVSNDNYMETSSYGLNAHSGLDIIREHMDLGSNEELVSFADVYAVMNSNKGYISQFTDTASVSHIQHVSKDGVITMIQVEGLATSQDNYTGANAEQVGIERNTALSQNRAQTVISWLKTNEHMKEVASQICCGGR